MAEMIIAGESFNVIVEGDAHAPTVVLSHALGTNLHLFDKQVDALRRHFRVVRYDARGHGRSVVSQGPYSISQLGHDALAIFDALSLEKVHWIGHSEGGIVGLWLLTRAPERIERAVLANTAAQIGGAEIWNERIRTTQEKGVEALAASVLENWFTRQFRGRHPDEVRRFEEVLVATEPEGYAASCAAIRDADLRGKLGAITNPVLVIVGRHDPVTPPGVGALIASSMPNARLVTLEAAHLSPVEAAEAFNQAAVEFLSGKAEKTMQAPEQRPDDLEDKNNHENHDNHDNHHAHGSHHETGGHDDNDSVTEEETAPEPEEAPKKPRRPRAPRPKPQAALNEEADLSEEESDGSEEPEHSPSIEPTRRAPPRRRATRKSATKKSATKKAAVKKTGRRTAGRKAAPKKTARKTAPRKSATKKSTARRGAVKKAVRKPVRKAAVKKRAGRKSALKRSQPKKSALRKTAGRRRPSGRRSPRRGR